MKQEHPGREAQESPGFSRGKEVNLDSALAFLHTREANAYEEE